MSLINKSAFAALFGLAILCAAVSGAAAQERQRPRDRPLTITKHAGAPHRGTGIEVRDHGNEIIAWGGFSANGFGHGSMGGEAARRAARNDSVRARTAGVYGYGLDGLGGTFQEGRTGGYNNPFYGNSYNSYTGYNGVPTALAFGPGFANRHITDSDDDDADDLPGPTPGELGYGASPAAFGDTDD